MSAEWKGKVEIEGAQKAASDMDRVGQASTDSARKLKSVASAAGGVMTIFHGLRAVASGDASALISVASGASLAWRALSNLHPALRVVTIAGTALAALWPKIAQHFQSAAQRAEKFRKAMQDAGLAVSAYVRAQESAEKINGTLYRQAKAAQQAATAWKNLADANAQYNSANRSLTSAGIDLQLARDMESAGDDPVAQAAAQHKADLSRAGLVFEAATEQTRREKSDAVRAVDDLALQSDSAAIRLGAARNTVRAAESDFGRALYTATPLADAGDIAMMTKQARAGNRDAFTASAARYGADVSSPEKLKALGSAYENLQKAVREEEDALSESRTALKALADARETLVVSTKAAATAEETATAQQGVSVELADITLRKAQKDAVTDLEEARREEADYQEERRFAELTPKQQIEELDTVIAQKERDLATMSESDPAAVAKEQRKITELKRKRDAIKDSAEVIKGGSRDMPGEGFEDYVADTLRAGPRMSMTRGAIRFRGKLAPSFKDKLTSSQFWRGGAGDADAKPKTADEQLAALQGTANGYLATIAAKVQELGIKE